MFKKTTHTFIFIFYVFLSFYGFSQLSTTHYIPPLTSAEFGNAYVEDQYIYLSTPSTADITYTIAAAGESSANYITGSISNTNPREILIANGDGQLFIPSSETSQVMNNGGYIVTADAPIYVSVRVNAGGGAQAGALVSKGISALGTIFRAGSYTNENAQSNYLNFVSVMATEDNTQVTFGDLPSGLVIKNYTGTTPVTITLNQHESYIIATNSSTNIVNRDGLIGCLVTATKPIAVNTGSANGSFDNGSGRDYGIDQIAGLSKVGKEYIFVKGNGSNNWENILIVAHTDNTSISINGNPPIASINAGEYYLIEGNQYSINENMYVATSEDVFAYQGTGATSEANQGLFFVPPLSCETRGNIDNIATIDRIGNTVYAGGLSIVSRVGATITINNSTLSNFSVIGPNMVTGNPDYVTYKVTGLSGTVSVQGNDELYVAYFNVNGNATSGGFYSGFPSPPLINLNTAFATLGNCIPNIILEAANSELFDSLEWFFDDTSGSGFQSLGSTPNITPSQAGVYKLSGRIACNPIPIESLPIPISLCPDDRDNDGIIDNIDMDNDNDGVLNCLESLGDVTINLADSRNPTLVFQDATTNNAFVTSTYTQNNDSTTTNSFVGDTSGNFTSTILAGVNSENEYTLNFANAVNIKFSENATIDSNTSEKGIFIVKILPASKNITLVDPDNHLLVDTNFDGVFEVGIKQVSGSEIHFKINPNATGTTSYDFFANQIDSFTLTHRVSNTTMSSVFNGIVGLTCFDKDTDNDTIYDAYDLDSENDGIPDFVENQGVFLPLSGIDIDLNGLDDIYNITQSPIDTDGDGILDIYDLDSDNDGITDLLETGMLGILLDHNLDGIEDGSNVGTNGWVDAAESTPDSNTLGFLLNNPDNDSSFSYIDADSDGDGCSDVLEAGFSDANMDTYLGDRPPRVNAFGLVTNATDGYSIPNADYITEGSITISEQPIDTAVCLHNSTTLSISLSTPFDNLQWQLSTDRGASWSDVMNSSNIYSGATTTTLTIANTPSNFDHNYYRALIERNGNSCGLYSEIAVLTVHPQPIISSSVTLTQCDDDDPITIGFSFFNLIEANDKISANAANESFFYYTTEAAAQEGDLSSPEFIPNITAFENSTMNSDQIWARVENTLGCFSISQIQLSISSTAILTNILEQTLNQCDDFLDRNGNDNGNNNDRDGIAQFDFSTVDKIIKQEFIRLGQDALIPRYFRNKTDALAEENEIIDISNYRNIETSNSQLIYVRVDSAIENDCLGLKGLIRINVNPLPEFEVETPRLVCTSDPTFSIDLEPIEINSQEAFNYEWRRTSPDNTVSNQFISNNRILTATLPGKYTITLTKADGTSCSRSKSVNVQSSEVATITQNDIKINDLSNNNTVYIATTNLGIGTYDYALLEAGGTIMNYQDEPFFENVNPGFYTIHVRDMTCGTATINVSILGHPRFFTPNGDGINDIWQIKGLDTSLQTDTVIYIFDRYGKLLKQMTGTAIGWDGAYLGQLLPTDDYWFKILLADGRTYSGHFTLKR